MVNVASFLCIGQIGGGLQDVKHKWKELKIFAAHLQDDAKDNHQHKIFELQSIDLRLRAVLGKTAAC